jgi:hypothetical protein
MGIASSYRTFMQGVYGVSVRRFVLAAAFAVLAFPAAAPAAVGDTLVQVGLADDCRVAPLLLRAGATRVASELGVWMLPTAEAGPVTAALRDAGALLHAQPDRLLGGLQVVQPTDPLVPEEWWRATVRADQLEPPGPGKPVSIVDSGIDTTHPEFVARPSLIVMNEQSPTGGGTHGTQVTSLAGAPADGQGMVGIYPQALLNIWDAAPSRGLETSLVIAGITAAARAGKGVLNLSLSGRSRDAMLENAVNFAVASGSLVIAAAGNSREEGSPLEYPAALPHVLTVAATTRDDTVAEFSSASPFVDLAAPGVDMVTALPVALGGPPYGSGFAGTSFSSPLVAGAAAWVWTVRPELDASQLFEIMRRSSRDVGPVGRDDDTGFGILDVAAALAFVAPVRDPLEPNEDVDEVRPNGFFSVGVPPLSAPGRVRTRVVARLDRVEDPRDVYRIWVPARTQVDAVLTPDADVNLSAWRPTAASVLADARSERLALSSKPGTTQERVFVRNAGAKGTWAYVSAELARATTTASYRMALTSKPVPAPAPKPKPKPKAKKPA